MSAKRWYNPSLGGTGGGWLSLVVGSFDDALGTGSSFGTPVLI